MDRDEPAASRARQSGSFDRVSEKLGRGLASRLTRRSLIGDVGKGTVALAAGAVVGGSAVGAEDAEATHCGGCGSCSTNSVRCEHTNWGKNSCPDGSCWCGHWCCNGPCNGVTRWIDCCRGCGSGNGTCTHGNGTTCMKKCCNPKEYTGGCGNFTTDRPRIKCRIYRCGPDNGC